MAFPTGYTLYQNVTIDNTQVDATLTDYPCLVDLSDMLKAGDDVFDTCRTDGGDIRVTLTDGTTQLAREIVSIDTTAKTGEMHVKIPSLASGTDTVIRVWYNGADTEPVASSTYGSENVWTDYEMVLHMNDDTTSTILDSTANNHDGTKSSAGSPAEIISKIGEGQDFSGANQITISTDATMLALPGTHDFCISFWHWSDITGGNDSYIRYDGTDDLYIYPNDNSAGSGGARVFWRDMGGSIISESGTDISGAYHKFDFISRASNDHEAYRDGSSVGSSSGSGTAGPFTNFIIGVSYAGEGDETRLRSSAPSDGWLTTEYNNQDSPVTFYSVGDEQTSGGLSIELNDTINISDSISLKLIKTLSDSTSMSDSIIKNIGLNKSDSITLSDNLSNLVGIIRSDTITMSDNFNAIITLILSLNDTINMSDDLSKSIGLNKSDTINLTDNISIISEFIRSLGDTINISDAISKEFVTSFSDTINMTDNFDALVALILALNDSITMSDSLVSKDVGLNKSDTISLSDEIIKSFGLTKSDIVNISDHFSSSADIISALLDFVAKNRNFNFNAKKKTFNFNAKSRGDN